MTKKLLGRSLSLALVPIFIGILWTGPDRSDAQAPGTANTKAPPPKADVKKTAPAPQPPPEVEPLVTIAQVAEINKQIEAQWQANNITPSKLCSDLEFIRRASLDLIGRIATVDEIIQFRKDPAQSRRGLLVDRLLEKDEYAQNWANVWTVWLMTRSGNPGLREQMQLWLEEQFSKKNHGWDKVVAELLTATGDNDPNGAVNFILSHLGEPTPQNKRQEEGMFQFVPITSRTTRLFLGVQIQCTQCHDHPFNPQWKQKHFWGVNAFFRQVVRGGDPAMMRNQQNRGRQSPKLSLIDDGKLNPDFSIFYETRKAVVLKTRASFLDGKKFDPGKKDKSRRQQLAEFITEHESFPKAYVNRMWGHFFSRGMTINGKDVDDFGEHNAETHPELLDFLAKEFKNSGYDARSLMRWICNSKAYSLSCVANDSNDKSEAEPFFARMLLKSLSPEQLFDSLRISTYANPGAVVKKSIGEQNALREKWMNSLVQNFGDDEGNETTFNGTVIQALQMMNGQDINDAINDKDGPVAAIFKPVDQRYPKAFDNPYLIANKFMPDVMNNLYLTTLNRSPTKDEVMRMLKDSEYVLQRGKTKDRAHWERVSQDIFWALLNSSEFVLNH